MNVTADKIGLAININTSAARLKLVKQLHKILSLNGLHLLLIDTILTIHPMGYIHHHNKKFSKIVTVLIPSGFIINLINNFNLGQGKITTSYDYVT